MKIIGFTGTRDGLTRAQILTLNSVLKEIAPTEGHHGDCTGGDEWFHSELIELRPTPIIVIHPGSNWKGEFPTRSWCDQHSPGVDGTEIIVLDPKPYLDRDRDIVKAAPVLIACPKDFTEKLRSGTWTTVRYARKEKRHIIIIFPDGSMKTEENGE